MYFVYLISLSLIHILSNPLLNFNVNSCFSIFPSSPMLEQETKRGRLSIIVNIPSEVTCPFGP